MKGKTIRPPLGVGMLTVLMVLVVLLLCSFSVMSLLSANADARLTEKAKSAVIDYYDADTKAEQKAAQITQILQSADKWQQALFDIGVSVTIQGDHALLGFAIPSGKQELRVTLDQPLRNGMPYGNFTRTKWQISSDMV